jgi:hypothetical protein
VLGHSRWAEQVARCAREGVGFRSLVVLAVDDRRELLRPQAHLGDSRAQLVGDVAPVEAVLLGLAGIQGCGLRGPRAGLAAVLHAFDDLPMPAALIAQHGSRDAFDLGRQLARRHRLRLHPQPPVVSARSSA